MSSPKISSDRLQEFIAQMPPGQRARYQNLRSVDPKIDCVFKAILGSEEHKHLLVHFLNAVLETKGHSRIVDVHILNPFNPKATLDDKLSIVDIKARNPSAPFKLKSSSTFVNPSPRACSTPPRH